MAGAHTLLQAAGVEALARFADFHVQPRASYAEAFAHRFPAQLARGPLTEHDPAHLLGPGVAIAGLLRRAVRPAEELGL